MKKTVMLVLLCIIIPILYACGTSTEHENGDTSEISPKTIPADTVYTVTTESVSESVSAEDGTVLLTVNAEYPVFSNPGSLETVDEINTMYAQSARSYADIVLEQFSDIAVSGYNETPESFAPYSFNTSYEITYDKKCIISVKRDYHEVFPGYNTLEYYADVYDMTCGLPMYADELINAGTEDVMQIIYLGFTSVASENPDQFYPGYEETLNEALKSVEFYLTQTGMVFVIQPGIISYPEYGCQLFTMPYAGNEKYFLRLQ